MLSPGQRPGPCEVIAPLAVGVSPDGKLLALSETERMFSLMIAEGVPGLPFSRKGS